PSRRRTSGARAGGFGLRANFAALRSLPALPVLCQARRACEVQRPFQARRPSNAVPIRRNTGRTDPAACRAPQDARAAVRALRGSPAARARYRALPARTWRRSPPPSFPTVPCQVAWKALVSCLCLHSGGSTFPIATNSVLTEGVGVGTA